jgi:hypothetical protein
MQYGLDTLVIKLDPERGSSVISRGQYNEELYTYFQRVEKGHFLDPKALAHLKKEAQGAILYSKASKATTLDVNYIPRTDEKRYFLDQGPTLKPTFLRYIAETIRPKSRGTPNFRTPEVPHKSYDYLVKGTLNFGTQEVPHKSYDYLVKGTLYFVTDTNDKKEAEQLSREIEKQISSLRIRPDYKGIVSEQKNIGDMPYINPRMKEVEGIIVFKGLVENIKNDSGNAHLMFGMQRYIHDSTTDSDFNLFFHSRNDQNVERFAGRGYSIMPVIKHTDEHTDIKNVLSLRGAYPYGSIFVMGETPVIYGFEPRMSEWEPMMMDENEMYRQNPKIAEDVATFKKEIDSIK